MAREELKLANPVEKKKLLYFVFDEAPQQGFLRFNGMVCKDRGWMRPADSEFAMRQVRIMSVRADATLPELKNIPHKGDLISQAWIDKCTRECDG